MLFIKDCSYKNVKWKFIILYMLNVSDIVFTLCLLETGLFIEANSFMVGIVTDPILSIIIKVVMIGVLLLIVYKRMASATDRQLKIGNYIFNVAIILYGLINLSHIIWLFLYILV